MIHIIYMAAGNSRRFGSNKLLYEWKGKPLYRHGLDTVLEAIEIYRRREAEKRENISDSLLEGSRNQGEYLPEEVSLTVVTRFPEIMEYVKSLRYVESLRCAESQECAKDHGFHGIQVINSPLSEKGTSYTIKAGIESVFRRFGEERDVDLACPGTDCSHEENPLAQDRLLFMVADQPGLKTSTLVRLMEESREHPLTSLTNDGKPANPCVFSGRYLEDFFALEGDKGGRSIIKREEKKGLEVFYLQADEEEVWDLDELPGTQIDAFPT